MSTNVVTYDPTGYAPIVATCEVFPRTGVSSSTLSITRHLPLSVLMSPAPSWPLLGTRRLHQLSNRVQEEAARRRICRVSGDVAPVMPFMSCGWNLRLVPKRARHSRFLLVFFASYPWTIGARGLDGRAALNASPANYVQCKPGRDPGNNKRVTINKYQQQETNTANQPRTH